MRAAALNTLVDEMLWSTLNRSNGILSSAACELVSGKQVAIVGNGPLSIEQRSKVNSAAVITMRFNALNSW